MVEQGRIVVGGFAQTPNGSVLAVRALVWEHLVDTGGGLSFEGTEVPFRMAVHGSRLFVVGRAVDATGNWNFVVRAYYIDPRSWRVDDDDDVDNQQSTGSDH